MALSWLDRYREASGLASEYEELLESIGDPAMTVGLLWTAMYAKFEYGAVREALRLAQRGIDLADGDPVKGNLIIGSPLAVSIGMRGIAGACLGHAGWKDDVDHAIAMAGEIDPLSQVLAIGFKYVFGLSNLALISDETANRTTAVALHIAEQSGDDLTLNLARAIRGLALVQGDGTDRRVGFDMLNQVRETAVQERYMLLAVPFIDVQFVRENMRSGDLDSAISLMRKTIDDEFVTGEMIYRGPAAQVLVESLLERGADGDVREAEVAIDRLAAVPVDPGFVLHELPLLRLRALLARAGGDEAPLS